MVAFILATILYAQTYETVGLPKGGKLNSEEHEYSQFYLSYANDYKNPQWVMWILDYDRMKPAVNVSRKDQFHNDQFIKGANTLLDFKNDSLSLSELLPTNFSSTIVHSIYQIDKGHICPANDNNNSTTGMYDCFTMANMSPQYHIFNNGIWKKVESLTSEEIPLDIKMKYGYNSYVYVVAGPVLDKDASCYKKIGASKNVVVPEKFYKIYLIQKSDSTYDAVAWIIPQSTVEEKDAEKYKVSIDEIEKETGLDFFSSLPDNIEEKIESMVNMTLY